MQHARVQTQAFDTVGISVFTSLTVGGQPFHVVSRQLGHSSARVTSGTYGHVLVAQDALAAAETERLLFGDG